MTLKLLLMGTGEFAVPAFAALADGPHEVVGLVTQPDRGGPGHHAHRHPLELIKSACLEQGVPVLQPPKVNAADAIAAIAALAPDLAVVAAYGQILRPELIGVPRLGAINLHASLLPRHRGATPIHHAILAGDTQTGVSVFQIEPAVDTGPLLGVVRTEIGPCETPGGTWETPREFRQNERTDYPSPPQRRTRACTRAVAVGTRWTGRSRRLCTSLCSPPAAPTLRAR